MPVNTEKNKTIKQFKSEYSWDNREKALIFYHSKDFKKKFTDIVYKRFAFPVSSIEDLDSFFVEFNFSKYYVIYLEIDPIFNKLDHLLTNIRSEYSKNKRSKIYFVTSSIENSIQLNKFNLPKNITPLLQKGEDIVYPGGKKYIY